MEDTIVLDFETFYGVRYSLTQLSYENYIFNEKFQPICVGVKVNNDPTEVIFGHERITAVLRRLLPKGNNNVVVCHNVLFDGAILEWVYGVSPARYICTKTIANGLWPYAVAGLAAVARRCYPDKPTLRKGTELVKFKDKRYEDFTPTDQKIMKGYCAQDVDITHAILWYMLPYVPDEEKIIMDLTLKMFLERPFNTNRPLLHEFMENKKMEKAALVAKSGLPQTTLTSNKKFAGWIISMGMEFEEVDSPTEKNPDNKKWPLAKDSDEYIELKLRYPQYQAQWDARAACSSNIEITRAQSMLDHSRMHMYNMEERLGLALQTYGAGQTLRWSGTNRINGQNLPRGSDLRRALIAPEGYELAILDQKNIEGRVLAWLSGEAQLISAFRRGEDVYCLFAEVVYGRPIREEKDPQERFVGKVCTLALGYQAGYRRLRKTLALGQFGPPLALPQEECRDLVYKYRTTYPMIPNLWQEAEGIIQVMRTLNLKDSISWRGLSIRRHCIVLPNHTTLHYNRLHSLYDEETERERTVYWNGDYWADLYGGKLVENLCQALARLIIAKNMLDAHHLLTHGYDGKLGLMVHDEIVTVIRSDQAQQYYNTLAGCMRTPPAWCPDIPLDVSGGIDKCYSK